MSNGIYPINRRVTEHTSMKINAVNRSLSAITDSIAWIIFGRYSSVLVSHSNNLRKEIKYDMVHDAINEAIRQLKSYKQYIGNNTPVPG